MPTSPELTRLPSGVVTFMFTDIERSTELVHLLGDEFAQVLNVHRELFRSAFDRHDGVEVVTTGDGFFVAFSDARSALEAAIEAQRALAIHEWPKDAIVRVRIGLHTGHPTLIDGDYVGLDVHRASRIADAGHGGQIVVSETTQALLGGATTARDLGHHRLKGLEDPERIYQVLVPDLRQDFPPLRSLTPPTNIPAALEPIVGRSSEIEELQRLVAEENKRLITIFGPGGAGKTRLSAEVALSLHDKFIDGVFFVDLTNATADGVETAIADVLAAVFATEGADTDLASSIGNRRMLLVLDNFEQAIDAATQMAGLLDRCHGLSLLVTSQVVLRIRGEHEYPLTLLTLPVDESLESVQNSSAAQLFIRRATAANPTFEVDRHKAAAISQICRLLDGLPLALELAATRTRLLTVEDIVARLENSLKLLTRGPRDAPARHQTLRATLDWSYGLLGSADKDLFRRFAVFEGGADLHAIEAVIDPDGGQIESLTTLVEHSLIRRNDGLETTRFSMLQTVRSYAMELLDTHTESDSVRERHASYYLQLAESLSNDEHHALDREMDNCRSALDWWVNRCDRPGSQPLRLAAALGTFWYRHGHAVEGIAWFERALEVAHDPPPELRATALRSLGVLVESAGELERARRLFEEALEDFRTSRSKSGEAASLNSLGVVMRALGDLDSAESFFERAMDLRRSIGEEAGLSTSTSNLGIAAMDRGDYVRAKTLFETALELDTKLDDDWAVTVGANNLAVAHLELGNIEDAAKLSKQALRGFGDYGDKDGIAESLEVSVGVAGATGRLAEAVRLAGAADSLRRAAGLPLTPPDRKRLDDWMTPLRSALAAEDFEQKWDEGAAMTPQQAIEYVLRDSPP